MGQRKAYLAPLERWSGEQGTYLRASCVRFHYPSDGPAPGELWRPLPARCVASLPWSTARRALASLLDLTDDLARAHELLGGSAVAAVRLAVRAGAGIVVADAQDVGTSCAQLLQH